MIADIDAVAEAGPVKFDLTKLPHPTIQNGYYTITFPCGSHRTFRLYTQQKGPFAGKRLLGMLIGPDNTSDYEDFAFLFPLGFTVWKRFREQKQAEYAAKLFTLMKGGKIEDHELALEGRCLRCNRPLTDPESIRLGIGPFCRRGHEAMFGLTPTKGKSKTEPILSPGEMF